MGTRTQCQLLGPYTQSVVHYVSTYLSSCPQFGAIWPSWGGGGGNFSKQYKNICLVKQIHLIYKYKASDSLNFYEIKFN